MKIYFFGGAIQFDYPISWKKACGRIHHCITPRLSTGISPPGFFILSLLDQNPHASHFIH